MNTTINAYIRSLGCKVNQVEMEEVAEELFKAGIKLREVDEKADLVLINTCSVTKISDKKSRQLIRKASASNPEAIVIVTGCYATNDPDINKIDGVDIVVTNEEKNSLFNTILQAVNLEPLSPDPAADPHTINEPYNISRSRPYIKIADGCNEFCAYCIIPSLRGPLTSQPIDNIKGRAEELTLNGAPEIVITGINIGKYAQDSEGNYSLGRLIEHLHGSIPGLPRLRLSSIELNEVDGSIIEQIKKGIICRHLHIPLQSGSDTILKRMNRHYTRAEFIQKVSKIKKEIDGICISTDVIAGFPGETESDFAMTIEALERSGIDKVHAFKFSSRTGTAASQMQGHLNNGQKAERVSKLNALGDMLYNKFITDQQNKDLQVILEDKMEFNGESLRVGLSDNYIKILVNYEGSGKSVKVRTAEVDGNYLRADIAE